MSTPEINDRYSYRNPAFLKLQEWVRKTSADPNYRGLASELGGPGEDVMLAVLNNPPPRQDAPAPAAKPAAD